MATTASEAVSWMLLGSTLANGTQVASENSTQLPQMPYKAYMILYIL